MEPIHPSAPDLPIPSEPDADPTLDGGRPFGGDESENTTTEHQEPTGSHCPPEG